MVDEHVHVVGGTALGFKGDLHNEQIKLWVTRWVNESLTDTLKRTRTSGQVDWGVCGLQGPVRNGLGPDSHAIKGWLLELGVDGEYCSGEHDVWGGHHLGEYPPQLSVDFALQHLVPAQT